MKEFKVLLIDDDSSEEELLKEAVCHFNKTVFIDSICKMYDISDEKLVSKLKLMNNNEDILNTLKNNNFLIKDDDVKNIISVSYKTAKTPEQAMVLLYKEDFNSLIVDLSLKDNDSDRKDEDLSGNVLLNNILNREIIPIIVRSNNYKKITHELSNNIVNVYSKDDKRIEEVLKELLDCYDSSAYNIFSSNGKIMKLIKDFFWNIFPECFVTVKDDFKTLDKNVQEKVIIRYITNWLNNKYSFDEECNELEPIEMYMFTNNNDKICTCDIYEDTDSKENYVVLTPACDLANDKADTILLAKIITHDSVEAFKDFLKSCRSDIDNNSNVGDKKKKTIAKFARNGHDISMKYHFLPKVKNFEGGFIDFSSLICIDYDKKLNKFKNRNMKKIGTITDSFKKDIVGRFSSYYQRQGQPEFNIKSLLKNHL